MKKQSIKLIISFLEKLKTKIEKPSQEGLEHAYTDSKGNLYTITINGIALLLRGLNAQNAASFQ